MAGYNFTDDVRRALQVAREEALKLRHDQVEPLHILQGILRAPGATCTAALGRLSAEPKMLSSAILSVVPGPSREPAAGPDIPYAGSAKRVLEGAMVEARDLHHPYVAPEHLVLGVLRQGGEAATILGHAGVTLEGFRAILRELGQLQESANEWQVMRLPPSLIGWVALIVAVVALLLAIRAQP